MEKLERQFERHEEADDQRFSKIDEKLSIMKDNHLFHIEKDMSSVSSNLIDILEKLDSNILETKQNSTNIDWMLKIGGSVWGLTLVVFSAVVYLFRDLLVK